MSWPNERRRAVRYRRLLKVSFDFEGETHIGVTTDVSSSGMFVNALIHPPIGAILSFEHEPPGGDHTVVLRGEVTRRVDLRTQHSVIPGVGVRFLSISTRLPAELRRFLYDLLGQRVDVELTESGRSEWLPCDAAPTSTPSRAQVADPLEQLKQDLAAIGIPEEEARPQVAGEHQSCRVTVPVTFFSNRIRREGVVRTIDGRGLWIETGSLPEPGDIVNCRYPVPAVDGPRWVLLIGVVLRVRAEPAGFALELVRTTG